MASRNDILIDPTPEHFAAAVRYGLALSEADHSQR